MSPLHLLNTEDFKQVSFFLSRTVICESPLFIRPHSKAVLSKAIYNDTEFLSNHMVMDYSLLIGIDEANFELVVGIIGEFYQASILICLL